MSVFGDPTIRSRKNFADSPRFFIAFESDNDGLFRPNNPSFFSNGTVLDELTVNVRLVDNTLVRKSGRVYSHHPSSGYIILDVSTQNPDHFREEDAYLRWADH